MAGPSFEIRELFHLTLLRQLGTRLSGRSYAVKGGICLRFFHRSPRLSEDMDLDIAANVRAETLRKAVNGLLSGQALLASLVSAGVTRVSATAPKQTETTQRWKIGLVLAGGETLRTKLEFSRRPQDPDPRTGVPDAELLRRYRLPPFAAQHYGSGDMAAQKILALASPRRNALRDLFDLHHLLFVAGVDSKDILKRVDSESIGKAAEKAGRFDFDSFREQVVPYLTDDLIALYADAQAFEAQRRQVEKALAELPG